MERIGLAKFRRTFHGIREPVEILRGTETVGYFYPGMRPPNSIGVLADDLRRTRKDDGDAEAPVRAGPKPKSGGPGIAVLPDQTDEESVAEIVAGIPKTSPPAPERFNTRPFTPVPKTRKK